MQPHFLNPDYGPSHFTLNFEVEPTVTDYIDASLQICFFIPCEKLLKSLSLSLRFLKRKERNILTMFTQHSGKQYLLKN